MVPTLRKTDQRKKTSPKRRKLSNRRRSPRECHQTHPPNRKGEISLAATAMDAEINRANNVVPVRERSDASCALALKTWYPTMVVWKKLRTNCQNPRHPSLQTSLLRKHQNEVGVDQERIKSMMSKNPKSPLQNRGFVSNCQFPRPQAEKAMVFPRKSTTLSELVPRETVKMVQTGRSEMPARATAEALRNNLTPSHLKMKLMTPKKEKLKKTRASSTSSV
mmetsp:Transcript_27847/g.57993  ORF Transcript_27847/g.57993 Transcript_27847/m.57993 type:complete len:221 (+) Transcript_27847:1928-2590(+)